MGVMEAGAQVDQRVVLAHHDSDECHHDPWRRHFHVATDRHLQHLLNRFRCVGPCLESRKGAALQPATPLPEPPVTHFRTLPSFPIAHFLRPLDHGC